MARLCLNENKLTNKLCFKLFMLDNGMSWSGEGWKSD